MGGHVKNYPQNYMPNNGGSGFKMNRKGFQNIWSESILTHA